jgi:GH43 family beta-xylosidase
METTMRKPRDFDSELKALAEKAKQLKERRVQQLGELVIATGADATDAETLAGALLVIAETSEAQRKEAWRKRGAAFFQSKVRMRGEGAEHQLDGTLPLDGGAASA